MTPHPDTSPSDEAERAAAYKTLRAFGSVLRSIRNQHGLTERSFAKLTFAENVKTYMYMEEGAVCISPHGFRNLCLTYPELRRWVGQVSRAHKHTATSAGLSVADAPGFLPGDWSRKSFGPALGELASWAGTRPSELAQLVGSTTERVNEWVRGVRAPTLEQYALLRELFPELGLVRDPILDHVAAPGGLAILPPPASPDEALHDDPPPASPTLPSARLADVPEQGAPSGDREAFGEALRWLRLLRAVKEGGGVDAARALLDAAARANLTTAELLAGLDEA